MNDEDCWKNIVQGHCADSYFLSVLSIIANDRELLKKLFVTHSVNEVGIYAFNFYVNGKLKEVVIDDYIPCDPANQNYPAFASSKKYGEIWVCLLEKAWAKLHGSYAAISIGTPELVF
jgi:calpain-15